MFHIDLLNCVFEVLVRDDFCTGGGDIRLNSESTSNWADQFPAFVLGWFWRWRRHSPISRRKRKTEAGPQTSQDSDAFRIGEPNNSQRSSHRPNYARIALMPSDLTQRRQQREAVAALRRRHRIHVSPQTPDPIASFDEMPKSILAAFWSFGAGIFLLGVYHPRFVEICRVYCRVIVRADSC